MNPRAIIDPRTGCVSISTNYVRFTFTKVSTAVDFCNDHSIKANMQ